MHVLVCAVLLNVHCIILSHVQGYKHKKAFIIAQSPMENTVKDFWKMIVERECTVVVMLCGFEEDGEVNTSNIIIPLLVSLCYIVSFYTHTELFMHYALHSQSVCHQYWSSTGSVNYDDLCVELVSEEQLGGYVERTLSVTIGKVCNA